MKKKLFKYIHLNLPIYIMAYTQEEADFIYAEYVVGFKKIS